MHQLLISESFAGTCFRIRGLHQWRGCQLGYWANRRGSRLRALCCCFQPGSCGIVFETTRIFTALPRESRCRGQRYLKHSRVLTLCLRGTIAIEFTLDRYIRSPELAEKVQDLISIAYPVELGVRLRALVYPVQKMYDDEFVIEPDARAYLEEFVVRFKLIYSLRLLFFILLWSCNTLILLDGQSTWFSTQLLFRLMSCYS
jgi:hypothetical protein